MSHASETSQTAQEYIISQLQLEAEAREAMPYQFDACTRPFGPMRQSLFSCLTCNPPPASPADPYTPAGVCYSCSISCHGEHELVELFSKRDFVCDCGTTRLPANAPCALRVNAATRVKGGVVGETPVTANRYNHNYRNRFCACGDEYNPHQEKGTMFQCLGLGSVEEGGCLEDWWHPECVVGWERKWYEKTKQNGHAVSDEPKAPVAANGLDDGTNGVAREPPAELDAARDQAGDPPLPPGFPDEDDFYHLICYKCVEANPWIKRYAGTEGFLPAVEYKPRTTSEIVQQTTETPLADTTSRKRKAEDGADATDTDAKRQRATGDAEAAQPADASLDVAPAATSCKYRALPPAPTSKLSLFLKTDFREHLCRCPDCFPLLKPHPQLLE
ncbi:MAG: hypothetical protein INR71_10620, partial [Terriglobus roseus]|nr:hypothetical protein [Terriglobus roseus]